MRFFRLDLLTLLISLFILNSCKNESSIGLGVISGPISGAFVDTSSIVVNTFAEDSVGTSNLAKNPLAYFTDPAFGVTETAIATDLNLPGSTAYTRPTGVISIDSARLVLKFASGFYGDSLTSKYSINVYQLKQQLSNTIPYYNTTNLAGYNSQILIGSSPVPFLARTHQNIKIYDIITDAPDTLMSVAPQVRVPISVDFINTFLFNASGTTLASNTIFQSTVKGLYITLDKTKTTGAGGVLMLQSAPEIDVYYKVNTGSAIDTGSVTLPIKNTATQIIHTYPTTIQTELQDTSSSRGTFYLQGLAGLRARVKFPNLLLNLRAGLLQRDSDIVINRAELVITPTPGSNIPYQPLPKITMYRLDIAHQRTYIEDGSPVDGRSQGSAVFGGFYSPSKRDYHFIVTAYCQDLLLGKTVDYGTYIAPVDTISSTASSSTAITSAAYLPSAQVAARTVAVGTDNTSAYKMKLNIIYTKVKKSF